MVILVTGGSGFIGSHVVDKLLDCDYEVRVFDIQKPHRNDVEFFKGDIRSLDELKLAMNDVDFVFHIAAFSNINKVSANPLQTIDLNIMSTAKVLESARNYKVERVLFASSEYVHGNRGHLYTTSKIASERICKDYNTLYGLSYTILRYSTAYGPRSRGEDVVSLFVQQAISNQPITIHGTGNQYRNFIYVEDLALGNVAALQKIAKNKTYELGNTIPITIKEVAETINRLFGNKLDIVYDYARFDDYEGTFVSSNLAEKELNWKAKTDFEEGVKKYIDSIKGDYI